MRGRYSIVLLVQSTSCVGIQWFIAVYKLPIQPNESGCVGSCTKHADDPAYSLTSQFCVLASHLLQFIIENETDLSNMHE